MHELRKGQSYPPIIAGFLEGLVAPVVELVVVSIISAFIRAANSINAPSTPLWLLLVGFLLVDYVRNVIVGLVGGSFAIGSLAGNILGLILFYNVVSVVSQEAATDSLLLTIALGGSLVLGAVLAAMEDRGNDNPDMYW